ncbi:MAG: hypothetical protein K0R31_171 [Clostridiales bacterium]|nr:hypothetical protein [Clostridiales bacterium]
MDTIIFKTKGVCSDNITLTIEGNIVRSVSFKSGCDGNLQGISRLIEGMAIEEVIKKLRGISCDGRETSCPDQLAVALEEIIQKRNSETSEAV